MSYTCLIPVFNTPPAHLIVAVDSVLNQNGIKCPVVIIDDGSKDKGTRDALEKLKSDRVTVHRLDNNYGTPTALNYGHEIIQSEWIFLMGSDDINSPHRFGTQAEYQRTHPEVDVIGTWLWAFREGKTPFNRNDALFRFEHAEVPSPRMYPSHHPYFMVNHGTVLYRNQVVKDGGLYNTKWKRGQDVELWERLYKAGAKFRNVTRVLYAMRRGPNAK